ncbi:hypothetical protein HG536_0B01930 [Torulaspora globosa]|uniref:ASTRA-associated protein 1 n=1 Tax=Torulaspora globosa TaxID=48254 RepID=A0A7G3ZCU4_9SACH|nr:uncharacterized protein HG536_0B01930 [Torulaspora globosa]QLL31330.1 hypothetical protein HG536_0B01930 [Torulaspora globosa]
MKEHHLNDIQLPEYSLRCHKSGVTASTFVEWPSRSSVPILITGDSSGLIVLWDLIVRRPLVTHTLAGGAQVVAMQDLGDGLIAILSKDHKLRLLEMTAKEMKSLAECTTSFEAPQQQLHEIYEVPVNTLNFANFVLQKLNKGFYRLICTNTQDSEAIDVYQFHLSNVHSLQRVFRGVTFGGVIQKLATDPESVKARKLGIVMRFLEHQETIYCGFESGLVVGFKIHDLDCERTNIDEDADRNHNTCIEIVYVSSVHYPEPVLALELNDATGEILTSSTKDVVGIHPPISTQGAIGCQSNFFHDQASSVLIRRDLKICGTNFKKVPASSIGYLAVVNGNLVASSWSGITYVLSPDYRVLVTMSKSRPNVFVSDSSQGSLQGANEEKTQKRHIKVSSLTGISPAVIQRFSSLDHQLTRWQGQNRRMRAFAAKSWCIIGYDDGSIAVHQI